MTDTTRRADPIAVLTAILTLLAIAFAIAYTVGLRGFIMTTPSMGTAIPVGSLVITEPATVSDLAVGEVVSFHGPAGTAVRTHRVVELGPEALTQGDLNSTPDPWELTDDTLIGRAVVVAPTVGWLIRMFPIIVGVTAAAMYLTRRNEDDLERFRLRVVGFYAGVALSVAIVRPLVGVQLLGIRIDSSSEAVATTVSTGLLPLRVVPELGRGIESIVMSPTGTVGETVSHYLNPHGLFVFFPELALTWPWWLGLAAFVLSPLLWLGLHAKWYGAGETLDADAAEAEDEAMAPTDEYGSDDDMVMALLANTDELIPR